MLEKEVSEQRLVKRLLDNWHRLKGDSKLPEIHKFNKALFPDLWENFIVLSIKGEARNRSLKYEHFGGELSKIYGKNLTGEVGSFATNNIPGANIISKLDDCINGFNPILEQNQFINKQSKIVKYRSCMLPFCNKDSDSVNHVVVGLSWKVF